MTENERLNRLSGAMEERKMVTLPPEAVRRHKRLKENRGGLSIKKRDGLPSHGVVVAEFLWANNGTFMWDRSDPDDGIKMFDNIYQVIAAYIYAGSLDEGVTQRFRIQQSAEYESVVRSGVGVVAKWLDEQHALPLFRCKESGSGNLVTTITVHPDFIVDEVTGVTAEQSQRKRDSKALAGQTKAAFRRISRDSGIDVARTALEDAFAEALSEPIPGPRRLKADQE